MLAREHLGKVSKKFIDNFISEESPLQPGEIDRMVTHWDSLDEQPEIRNAT